MFPGSEGFQGGAHRRDLRQLATSLCKHAEGGYQIIGEVSSDVRRNRRILTEILNALWRRAQSGHGRVARPWPMATCAPSQDVVYSYQRSTT